MTARRDSRTALILERSAAIVEAEGIDALTLQRVAEALGYVTTAIYRYFPSKDALVAALQRRAIAELRAHFSGELETLRRDLKKSATRSAAIAELLFAVDLYLELPTARPRAWVLVATLLGDPRLLLSREESERALPELLPLLDTFGAILRRVDTTAGEADFPIRLMALWSSLHGALSLAKLRRIAPNAPGPDDVGRAAAQALLVGWGLSLPRLAAARELLAEARPSREEQAPRAPRGGSVRRTKAAKEAGPSKKEAT